MVDQIPPGPLIRQRQKGQGAGKGNHPYQSSLAADRDAEHHQWAIEEPFEKAQHQARQANLQATTQVESALPPSPIGDPLWVIEEKVESQGLSSDVSLADPGFPVPSSVSEPNPMETVQPHGGGVLLPPSDGRGPSSSRSKGGDRPREDQGSELSAQMQVVIARAISQGIAKGL